MGKGEVMFWIRVKKTEQCALHTVNVFVGGCRGLRINTIYGKQAL